jgi:hypothetical protein
MLLRRNLLVDLKWDFPILRPLDISLGNWHVLEFEIRKSKDFIRHVSEGYCIVVQVSGTEHYRRLMGVLCDHLHERAFQWK